MLQCKTAHIQIIAVLTKWYEWGVGISFIGCSRNCRLFTFFSYQFNLRPLQLLSNLIYQLTKRVMSQLSQLTYSPNLVSRSFSLVWRRDGQARENALETRKPWYSSPRVHRVWYTGCLLCSLKIRKFSDGLKSNVTAILREILQSSAGPIGSPLFPLHVCFIFQFSSLSATGNNNRIANGKLHLVNSAGIMILGKPLHYSTVTPTCLSHKHDKVPTINSPAQTLAPSLVCCEGVVTKEKMAENWKKMPFVKSDQSWMTVTVLSWAYNPRFVY